MSKQWWKKLRKKWKKLFLALKWNVFIPNGTLNLVYFVLGTHSKGFFYEILLGKALFCPKLRHFYPKFDPKLSVPCPRSPLEGIFWNLSQCYSTTICKQGWQWWIIWKNSFWPQTGHFYPKFGGKPSLPCSRDPRKGFFLKFCTMIGDYM